MDTAGEDEVGEEEEKYFDMLEILLGSREEREKRESEKNNQIWEESESDGYSDEEPKMTPTLSPSTTPTTLSPASTPPTPKPRKPRKPNPEPKPKKRPSSFSISIMMNIVTACIVLALFIVYKAAAADVLELVLEEDAIFNQHGKPAINKLSKLPLLVDALSKKQLQHEFLNHEVLTQPPPDGSLPNINIREAILKILTDFPIDFDQFDRKEQLKKSGLGKVIIFLSRSDGETTSNRRLAKELVDKWRVRWHVNCNYTAARSSDKTVRLWDIWSGKCDRTFIGHRSMILSLAMSPDGRYMASGDEDGTIMMWDLSSGRCITPLVGHTSCVWTLAFSGEGSLLASGSADCTVKLWDVNASIKTTKSEEKTGSLNRLRSLKTLPTKSSPVYSLTFSRRNLLFGAGVLSKHFHDRADFANATEAVRWLGLSASAGHARAQYQLALCLHHGRGVDRSLREAAKWYLRSAESGYVRAMYNASLCFSSGEGFRQSHPQAKKWMKRAADHGHSKGQSEHGLNLFTEGDMMKAVVYLEFASRAVEVLRHHHKKCFNWRQ